MTTPQLRRELLDIPMPASVRALPIDARGYPVPFFVAYVDGVPDHRVADPRKRMRCINEALCWICGRRLGSYLAFVIGPMCAVNRISADAPMHRDCAEYSIRACPFLGRPHMVRREAGKPEGVVAPPGEMIQRNPGVMLLWITRHWEPKFDNDQRMLFGLGEPLTVLPYREGKLAAYEHLVESVRSGLPLLAAMEGRTPTLVERAELQGAVDRACALLDIHPPLQVEWPETAPPPPPPGRILTAQQAIIAPPGAV